MVGNTIHPSTNRCAASHIDGPLCPWHLWLRWIVTEVVTTSVSSHFFLSNHIVQLIIKKLSRASVLFMDDAVAIVIYRRTVRIRMITEWRHHDQVHRWHRRMIHQFHPMRIWIWDIAIWSSVSFVLLSSLQVCRIFEYRSLWTALDIVIYFLKLWFTKYLCGEEQILVRRHLHPRMQSFNSAQPVQLCSIEY